MDKVCATCGVEQDMEIKDKKKCLSSIDFCLKLKNQKIKIQICRNMELIEVCQEKKGVVVAARGESIPEGEKRYTQWAKVFEDTQNFTVIAE